MSYTQLNARITDQRLEVYNLPLLASGGENEVLIRCEFCDMWAGYGKTAVFYRKGGPVYHATVYETDITVPWEVMTDPGIVFFGIMGVAENTRTTEVVRLTVEQGAITTATATPKDPTPDIYMQLLAAYGNAESEHQLMQARIDNMVAARPGEGQHEYEFNDGVVQGTIRSNGVMAKIVYETISGTVVLGAGERYECEALPDEFAPLYSVGLSCSDNNLTVSFIQTGGWSTSGVGWVKPLIEFYNAGTSSISLDGQHGDGTFTLYAVQIPELQDIRVGVDGTAYDSAGTAVREQVRNATVTTEQIDAAVEGYLAENPPTSGATAEQVEQINENTESIGDIETALGNIIAIQESLIGGGGE